MGRIFVIELEGRTYKCKFCKTQLALSDDLVSRAFHSRRGKAYLFNNAINTVLGATEERQMLSGLHTVADIFCCCCGQIVGWKYVLFSLLSFPILNLPSALELDCLVTVNLIILLLTFHFCWHHVFWLCSKIIAPCPKQGSYTIWSFHLTVL
ncbi:hypothetical protein KSS87_002246 [Heliosperma pusillum]|nr:hypothetical protein KSS87_002246 [Heliosperma pusillum]